MAAIETSGLTKGYGRPMPVHRPGRPPASRRRARSEDLTIEVGRARSSGSSAPTARARATTIRLLLGFLHPTAGPGTVLGLDVGPRFGRDPARGSATCPGGIAFWDGLTGERLLDDLADAVRPPAGPPRRAARPARARRARDPPAPGPRLLARDAPEGRHHPGAPARSGAGDPRRADRGPRPAHAARVLRDPRGPAARPAGRSSSRRTSCPRSSACATGWRSSGTAGSSRSRTSRPCSRAASATSRCGVDGPAAGARRRPGGQRHPRRGRPAALPAGRRRRAVPGRHRRAPIHDLTIEPARLEEAFLEFYETRAEGRRPGGARPPRRAREPRPVRPHLAGQPDAARSIVAVALAVWGTFLPIIYDVVRVAVQGRSSTAARSRSSSPSSAAATSSAWAARSRSATSIRSRSASSSCSPSASRRRRSPASASAARSRSCSPGRSRGAGWYADAARRGRAVRRVIAARPRRRVRCSVGR